MTDQHHQQEDIMETTDQTTALVAEAPGVAAGRNFLMAPRNLGEAMEVAKMLSTSSFVPRDYQNKPGDVLAAIQFGAELGLPPLQALQGIAVINGRPSVWGDAALGLVLSSGTVELLDEKVEGEGETMVAICRAKRSGRPNIIEHRFSVADAKKANLWGKSGPWSNHPRRMLQMRSRGFVLRDGWSDVLKGLSIREVQQDVEPVDVAGEAIVIPRATDDPTAAIEHQADAETVAYITEPQRKRLYAVMREHGKTADDVKAHLGTLGIDSSTRIPADQYDAVVAWIEGKDAA